MKVFLTGGTGFIGLALAARWVADGADVIATAASLPPVWAQNALPGVRFKVVDVCDGEALKTAVVAACPDILVHCAALTPDETRERAGGTAAIFDVNVGGTANAVEAAAHAGVRRVVAFSSGSAYGRSLDEVAFLDEITTDCRPTALYAISKLAAEKTALRLGALHGLSVVTPRLSAAWGPWEYRTSMRQTLSPGYQIIESVIAGETPVIPPDAKTPLVFSEDAAAMITRLAASSAEGPVNIGSAEMVDLNELADQAIAVAQARGFTVGSVGRDVTIYTPKRPPMALGQLTAAIGDWPIASQTEALTRCLDWHSSLEEPRPF
ncbi:MAG: NAD-dependent epimerase/dehydratase family protein [Paracoccaceae bacterium]